MSNNLPEAEYLLPLHIAITHQEYHLKPINHTGLFINISSWWHLYDILLAKDITGNSRGSCTMIPMHFYNITEEYGTWTPCFLKQKMTILLWNIPRAVLTLYYIDFCCSPFWKRCCDKHRLWRKIMEFIIYEITGYFMTWNKFNTLMVTCKLLHFTH